VIAEAIIRPLPVLKLGWAGLGWQGSAVGALAQEFKAVLMAKINSAAVLSSGKLPSIIETLSLHDSCHEESCRLSVIWVHLAAEPFLPQGS
jgi:hypothetical protein